MPIVVNPSFVWPPEVDPVMSPDGRITAIVDPAHAGVLLRADFDDSVPDTPAVPEKVLRRNLLKNPSFEGGSEIDRPHIRVETSTPVVPDALSGTRVLRSEMKTGVVHAGYTFTGMTSAPLSGQAWAAAALRSRPGKSNASRYRAIRMADSLSSGDTEYTPVTAAIDATGWSTQVVTKQLRPGAVSASLLLYYLGSSGYASAPIAGDVYESDAWAIVTGNSESDVLAKIATYFDGDTPTSGNKRYRWASDGTSEEYIPATPFIPGHGATVARVRFERQDGSLVRSGNPAWAPGGYAHAYDHEATLGGGTLWRAVPIRFDGTEGTPSEYVGAVIPALTDGWAWLKPVADPNKAMLLKVEPPDLSYDGRVDTTSIAGSARPAATWDVLEGFNTQLRSLVREKPVADQLMALLDEGPVLAQFPACAGLPDFYFIRGKVDVEHVYWRDYPARRYQWEVISIDRPDTTDSPLRIPDLSYDTVERDWTTYDQLKSTVASYNKLLEP